MCKQEALEVAKISVFILKHLHKCIFQDFNVAFYSRSYLC